MRDNDIPLQPRATLTSRSFHLRRSSAAAAVRRRAFLCYGCATKPYVGRSPTFCGWPFYCLSQTETLVVDSPGRLVLLTVCVIVLPSLETTFLVVATTFPARLSVASHV
jgi:hypothetical protein